MAITDILVDIDLDTMLDRGATFNEAVGIGASIAQPLIDGTADENLSPIRLAHNPLSVVDSCTCDVRPVIDIHHDIVEVCVDPNTNRKPLAFLCHIMIVFLESLEKF